MGLANLYQRLEEHDKAIEIYRKALASYERTLGPDHDCLAYATANLGNAYRDQGSFEPARGYDEQTVEILEAALGPDHPRLARVVEDFARLHVRLGDPTDSFALFERGLAIREDAFGSPHPETRASIDEYAEVLRELGLEDEARQLERRKVRESRSDE